ncbi:MAG: hypothetical protein ACOX4Q_02010 [Syntrophomonadales bacterium]
MGNCIYCGQPAGLLRSKHRECAEKHDNGWKQMIDTAKEAAIGNRDRSGLQSALRQVAQKSFIPLDQVQEAIIAGWEDAVDHLLEDGNLDVDETNQLTSYAEQFELSPDLLNRNGAQTRFVKGIVLRELMEGTIPDRFKTDGLPFNFQKSEKLIWGFSNVDYYEDKTRRQYVGGSAGVSFRVAKGVYLRTGSFRGHPVEKTERVHVDQGILAVTTKHIYFGGTKKNFRVRFNKIVSFMPFADGVGIQRDAASAKPQIFVTGDGWFTYNLLMNAANLE